MFHFYKIPVGLWAENSINYLTNTFDTHFRVVSGFLNNIFELLIKILIEVPPYLFIIFSVILFYVIKRNKLNKKKNYINKD
jgi:glycine betaine/proline transport system permease protein